MTSPPQVRYINLRGKPVVIVTIQPETTKVLGRSSSRKLVKTLQSSTQPDPLSVLARLNHPSGALQTFERGDEQILLIPRFLPLTSITLLQRATSERGLVLGIGVNAHEEAKGLAIVKGGSIEKSLRNQTHSPSYPLHVHSTYTALCPSYGLRDPPKILQSLYDCRLMELMMIENGKIADLAGTILDFLQIESHTRLSNCLTEWLYISSVLLIRNPETLKIQLQAAEREYVEMLGPKSKRWPFLFGLELGKIMFWKGSPTFKTVPYPSSLLRLYSTLKKLIPMAALTPDCLPTFYKTGAVKLALHQDLFGEDVVGHRELVLLLFEGSPRQLRIARGNFCCDIPCSPDVTVILTPCANKYFFHGKLPSNETRHAVTFAFRKALSPQCF